MRLHFSALFLIPFTGLFAAEGTRQDTSSLSLNHRPATQTFPRPDGFDAR